MQKLKLLIPLALFLGAFFFACHEEDPLGNNQMADVTFVGRVIDESGNGVQDALVKAGEVSAVTDRNGVFRLNKMRLPAMHALVTVSKPGFFEISRPYIVQDEALQTITIQLLARAYTGSITTSSGGVINVPGGPKITFPANAFVDENGNTFNGQAFIYARYLDPSDPNLGLFTPGDMTAENAADEEVFLSTYGMIGVELETGNGQKLKIATGKTAELRMPILASQSASAPATIPLWHYDLEEGHWQEDGAAQRVGNEYVGTVSHFSFFNCDAPFPLTQVHGTIYLENTDQPLANALIRITLLATGAPSFGYTDGNGHFGGCIPKDEALKLEVLLPENCGGLIYYTENIGPFADVSTLPDIIIPASAQLPLLKMSGKVVNCSGQGIANGYLKLALGTDFKHFMFADANGSFKYNAVYCNNTAQTGELTGYDLQNLLESSPVAVSLPPNTVNFGNITVCTALTEYVRFTLDGGQEQVKVSPHGGLDVGTTLISSEDSISGNGHIRLSYNNSGQLGNFPITSLTVDQISANNLGTLSTNVSTYGNIGDFIIGNFGGNFQDFNGTNHNITGSYRVIRAW